jgi:hypothetical protein
VNQQPEDNALTELELFMGNIVGFSVEGSHIGKTMRLLVSDLLIGDVRMLKPVRRRLFVANP